MARRIAAGQQLFCMCMQDRVAANGRITALTETPDIEQQYPLSCYVRPHLRGEVKSGGLNTGKIALMLTADVSKSPLKGRRQFKSPHRLYWQYGKAGRCHGVGYYAHYTMTTQYLESIKQKLARYGWEPSVSTTYKRQLAFMEQHLEASGTSKDLRVHPWCIRPPASECDATIE